MIAQNPAKEHDIPSHTRFYVGLRLTALPLLMPLLAEIRQRRVLDHGG